ncbi:MAG: hypothetical protein K2H29_10390 [Oscillospiraceae bacterium]|nr:hypothetical protein [Oscillospiraceae bacterium]
MQLTLKIYEGKKVVKEYKAETVDFSFGVVEDILDVLDFDNMKTGDNKEIAAMIVKASRQLKPFLKDLFDGVTDEEIRHTRIQNLISVFKGLIAYTVQELNALSDDEKN